MNQYLNYFTRYPNKILDLIISNKIIDKKTAVLYQAVFEKFSILTVIFHKEIFEKDYFEKEKYDFYGMDNYFFVTIKRYQEYESNYNKYINLRNDIIKNFDIYNIRCETEFHINKSQFEYFLSRYENNDGIYWYTLCLNKCLKFSDDLISKYDHILSWEALQYSGNLNWTFELIESKKNTLNWMVISSYEFLEWDKEAIDKYKDYLIFSLGEGWRKKSLSMTRNQKGQLFEIKPKILQKNLFNFKLKGSISLCETISWSIEIIDKFYDYWDWEELCLNKGIRWDETLIDKYLCKINFKALSSNPSVRWSIGLIQKYLNNWDWAEISHNNGINFSYEMLLQFEDLLHWKPETNNWYWDEFEEDNNKKSLSNNRNIIWSLKIVEKFYDKIDFWRISLYGIIEENIIIKYSNEFDRKEECGWENYKWSDFKATEKIYKNGWENLKVNPHAKFSIGLIDFFLKYKTSITFSKGNLAHDGVIIQQDISLLELFKEKEFSGLTIDFVMLNDIKWGYIFFNNNFVNYQLSQEYIKPILSEKFSLEFLNKLKKIH